jgi:hypothetical protein
MKKVTQHSIIMFMVFFACVCAPAEEIRPGEYKTATLAPGESDSFTFNAHKGDVVSILMGGITSTGYAKDFCPRVELIEPNGVWTWTTGTLSASIDAKKISESGTCLIIARESKGNVAGSYGLSMVKNPGTDVNDPEDPPVPIVSGEYKSGYIDVGDLDGYSFYANRGDVVSILMGDVNDPGDGYWAGFCPQVELIEPNGARTFDYGTLSASIEAKTISQSGPHLIIARESKGNTACKYGLSMSLLSRAVGTPTISALSDEPDPVFQGGTLTLTALDVNDPDGWIVQVDFYRDLNGNGYLDRDGSDQLLGSDTNGLDGWSWSGSIGRLPPIGLNLYFAIAKDNNGLWSDPVSAMGEILAPIPGDINLDGEVNCDDLEILISNWMVSGCVEPSWCSGADLDQNGVVDTDDLQIIVDNWTKTPN